MADTWRGNNTDDTSRRLRVIRVSDYVMDRIAREGVKHVFMVSGGSGMFLIESLGLHRDLAYVCNHHEQAVAMAADAYPRITGNLGVALVTSGPATTNALTGVMCSWTDSIPMLVVSGQAKSTMLIDDTGLRQRGFHEANITKIVESVTKYAVLVRDPKTIAYHMDKAIFLAKSGRPGPVWIDIPVDIQGAMVDPADLVVFDPVEEFPELGNSKPVPEVPKIVELLKASRRPVIIAGHGIRLAQCQHAFLELVDRTGIPVVTSRNAFDIIHHDHPNYAGFIGNYGQRAANFTVQNADLVLTLGSRMATTMVGYEGRLFAREAIRIMVDIDTNQIRHSFVSIDLPVVADLRDFFADVLPAVSSAALPNFSPWMDNIRHWFSIFPNVTPAMRAHNTFVNPYYFYEVLSEEMTAADTLVWDQGATYHCAAVAFKTRKGQFAFSADGFTPMGYGLPAAIGACFAAGKKRTVCVHGDGGLQMNVQELQTVWHHKLPIKLFVFSNEGYTSIKHTQTQFFNGHLVGSDPASGVSCPDTLKIAEGYGIPAARVSDHSDLREAIRAALSFDGPFVLDVTIDPMHPIEPRCKSERLPNGRMVSKPLEDMYPYLDRELFRREMIVRPVEE
jgi:acetolactate synthase-1/2/3 large subunit